MHWVSRGFCCSFALGSFFIEPYLLLEGSTNQNAEGQRQRSLMTSVFNKDPFDDPFFNRPFGSIFSPSMFNGPSMFAGPSMFGVGGSPFGDLHNPGFLEHQPPQESKGPVIEEVSSDDEKDDKDDKEKSDHPRSSKAILIEEPDDEERKNQHMLYRNEGNRVDNLRPQSQTYSFHSSTVTYGGANGAYYTSSTTRRMGGDGVVMEESKEAHTTTGRATHRISKGIHNKGHSVTRKLNPDGNVDTVQMLHNLNEDQLAGFEETWMESARKHLPGGWNQGLNSFNNGHAGSSAGGTNGQVQRGWALPSTESLQNQGRMRSQMN
ncbi:hypothetical protein MRB53_025580 [Persea americana]|uniref:Uncharacterized protein n=1 Tax=Persea americana TaxID=3435 RepID=A0ACC2LFN5_PERAE|nr:hypothetical protein MRB53_025580 [Persea americana]